MYNHPKLRACTLRVIPMARRNHLEIKKTLVLEFLESNYQKRKKKQEEERNHHPEIEKLER